MPSTVQIGRLIDRDPCQVTVSRTVRGGTSAAGGFAEDTSPLGPFRVRIGHVGSAPTRIDVAGGSALRTDAGWLLLTLPCYVPLAGDPPAGGEIEDVVEAPPHGRFRVQEVRPITAAGEVVGYQAGLERVG